MRKLRLIAGGLLLVTLMITVISVNTAFMGNKKSTDVKSKELQVVKSVNDVNLLQNAKDTEKSQVQEKTTNEKVVVSKKQKKTVKAKKQKTKEKTAEAKKQKPEEATVEIKMLDTEKKTKKAKKKSSYKYVGEFKITAYCPCAACCGKSNGITASGTHAEAGRTIAADTSRFPFGTKLKIGDTVYTVEDTGGAINGNRIDMFCGSHSEALQWGVRYMDVYVVK